MELLEHHGGWTIAWLPDHAVDQDRSVAELAQLAVLREPPKSPRTEPFR